MKILLDMNIPPIWKGFLNNAGYDSIHWSKVGDIRAKDTVIMDWARINEYLVFTHDLDFGALLYSTNAKAPSVIQLRMANILPSEAGTVVLEVLKTGAEELNEGALITISPKRYRINILPFRKNT
jgi:predicted nuclease of predicted toxin-antitoxin system